jgi:hypothetical protein
MDAVPTTVVGSGAGKETDMASTPMARVDAYGLLPSLLVLLMLVHASLGNVAQAASV